MRVVGEDVQVDRPALGVNLHVHILSSSPQRSSMHDEIHAQRTTLNYELLTYLWPAQHG